jgi:hypothetical protein
MANRTQKADDFDMMQPRGFRAYECKIENYCNHLFDAGQLATHNFSHSPHPFARLPRHNLERLLNSTEATMRIASILAILFASTAFGDDGEHQLKVSTQRGFPTIENVTVYRTKNDTREVVGELAKFDKPLQLPNAGPFEVWVKPKYGIAVKAVEKLTVKDGQTHELKLGDVLGVVEVFGDNSPRAEKVVLTDTRDPGPGEKGHVAIQWVKDYRIEMCVPPGTYAVWVVPANGAKAQRVEDNVRVQAGRTVRVGD